MSKIKDFSLNQGGMYAGYPINLKLSTNFIREAEQNPLKCVKIIGQTFKNKLTNKEHIYNSALGVHLFENSAVEQSNVSLEYYFRLIYFCRSS